MPYAFKRKESVSESIGRVGSEAVQKVLKSCDEEELEAIHSARKQIKRIRALLRLVRCEVRKKALDQALDVLREAAGYLAPPRDAHVRLESFQDLVKRADNETVAARFPNFGALLKMECQQERDRFRKARHAKKVKRLIGKQPKLLEKVKLKAEGWAALAPGVRRSYRAARNCWQTAVRNPTPENLHEWRKRVKDLWYIFELLEPIWPEQMAAAASDFETLGELLGDEHDLHILHQVAARNSVHIDLEAEANELIRLIEPRRIELREAAFKLGKRLFAEKPSTVCERLETYWKRWKAKKNPKPKTAARSSRERPFVRHRSSRLRAR
jgi:CHAD domain-containing protein